MQRIRAHAFYGWILGVFLLSNGLAWAWGMPFVDAPLTHFYQYLDVEILENDLTRGLFYLHTQPPLFNLLLGAVLKAFPERAALAFEVLFGAMSLALLLSMAWLMRRLAVPGAINVALCAVFALHPNFIWYSRLLFYSLPVAFLLLLPAVALARYVATRRGAYAHLFGWLGAAVALTRPVYHVLWLAGVAGGAALLVDKRLRRPLLLGAIAPLLLVNAWYAKNYLLVGRYTPNSWLGMYVATGWELDDAEVEARIGDGTLPAVWARGLYRDPDAYRDLGYFPERDPVHPALDAPYRSTGAPNFNHRDYGRIADDMLGGALRLAAASPERYARRVGRALWMFLQPGFDQRAGPYLAGWTDVLHLFGALRLGPGGAPLNLLLIAFPLLVGFGAFCAVRGRPGVHPDPLRPVVAYLLLTILWVTVCVNLLHALPENDRMRWETDPLLSVLAGCALTAALRPVLRRVRGAAR